MLNAYYIEGEFLTGPPKKSKYQILLQALTFHSEIFGMNLVKVVHCCHQWYLCLVP